ncbi:alpha-hydroxy acid oxidase [Pseudomonas sp.]|uniref:alpha-hydroxy acid oxidase n=1 Tax=Pseudomonas sp. TaxID=306 RepID=UPI002602E342|nr:alpha-hydroxy acid oxidase [Pseudomonas sp.]
MFFSSKSVDRHLQQFLSLNDFEAAAKRHLPRPVFGYISGATEDNATLSDNRAAFDELGFVPRVLRNVSQRSQAVELFGVRYESPFGIAPMGVSALSGYRGDLCQARAAAAAGIPMILSSAALISLEEVNQAAPGTWFQAYMPQTFDAIEALVDRVMAAGIATLVVTVDSAVVPNRENNLRTGFKTPLRPGLRLFMDGVTHLPWSVGTFLRTIWQHGMPHFENATAHRGEPLVSRHANRDFNGREHLDWEAIRLIRKRWSGPLVLKGILHPDDARTARAAGVDGVIVSNHGGRQLDGAVSALRMLPHVVAASEGMEVMIDSGFRRGTDVLKAIALGAKCAFIGRPFNYAATVGGLAGVAHAIDLLKSEIRADMGLLGVNRLDELNADYLRLKRFELADINPAATEAARRALAEAIGEQLSHHLQEHI